MQLLYVYTVWGTLMQYTDSTAVTHICKSQWNLRICVLSFQLLHLLSPNTWTQDLQWGWSVFVK